jgi:phage head maturation protease
MTEMLVTGELLTFDEEKREIYGRIVPWEVDAPNTDGLHFFERGAFDGVDPASVVSRARHADPATGVCIALENKDDGQYARFRISRTGAGDEQLTLARDGAEKGLSIGIDTSHPDAKFTTEKVGNRTRFRWQRAVLNEVSTTWRPAFREAAILQVHERETMPETQDPAEAQAELSPVMLEKLQELQSAITRMDERQREFAIQAPAPEAAPDGTMQRSVKVDRTFALADVITTGNEGVVPDAMSSQMLGRIATGRPFLNSTTEIEPPSSGVNLLFPKITQRPLVGTQATEKAELASQATIISTVDFPMLTKGGAADLSMQLIRRSSPQFLNLWLELLAQAYAANTEDGAIDALIAEAAVVEGGIIDPAAPAFGAAFTTTTAATGRTMKPDRIWLSTAGLVAFMNEREPAGGGGAALYPGLAGIGSGGNAELGFQLQPVWVPELDNHATIDVLIGPSGGFVWAEDGTYTLQADVPAKFGRDVGMAGMIWYAPIYPAAFTSYTLV